MESLRSVFGAENYNDMFTAWLHGWMTSYVVFKDGADIENIGNEFEKLVSDNMGEESGNIIPFLININDLHFDSEVEWNPEGQGNMSYVYIFGSIAILLILIASINYMNLATARSTKRAKEVGLRKVAGSRRGPLLFQFLSESVFLTLISLVIIIILIIRL